MIDRIHAAAETSAISESLALIPERIRERIGPLRLVVGIDPVFAGYHRYERIEDGRSYRDTAHFCEPRHLYGGGPATVILPEHVSPRTVTHELGHALDCALDYEAPRPEPVSEYAQTNGHEAFAEAFTAWLHPDLYPWAAPVLARDPILRIFEELS